MRKVENNNNNNHHHHHHLKNIDFEQLLHLFVRVLLVDHSTNATDALTPITNSSTSSNSSSSSLLILPNITNVSSTTTSSNTSSTNSTANLLPGNNSVIIKATLRFWGSLFALVFVAFCLLRHYFPRLFNIRSWVEELECDIAKTARYNHLVDWVWKVFQISDDDLLDACGMDALCFLRALRFGRRLSYIGCLNGFWLIPLYYTAPTSPETAYLTDPLVITSLSNLPTGSRRFLGTVIAAYITFIYSMYLIYMEYQWFTKYRHKFQAFRRPRNYAVYVSGIPTGLQSSFELRQFFEQGADVLEAHVAMNIPKLENKVARREAVVRKLEHAIALEKLRGKTKMHHKVKLGQRKIERVETVAALQQQLQILNKQIEKESNKVIHLNDPKRSKLIRAGHATKKLSSITFLDEGDLDEISPGNQPSESGRGRLDSWGRPRLDSLARGRADSITRTRADSVANDDEMDDELAAILNKQPKFEAIQMLVDTIVAR